MYVTANSIASSINDENIIEIIGFKTIGTGSFSMTNFIAISFFCFPLLLPRISSALFTADFASSFNFYFEIVKHYLHAPIYFALTTIFARAFG